MRQGNNNNNNHNRRQRGRNNNNNRRNNNNNQPNRNQVYDSNGPGIRVRGNAQQVMEKYMALARDSQAAGNHVQAEAYYQHGEHYLRIHVANQAVIEEARARKQAQREERQAKQSVAEAGQPVVVEVDDSADTADAPVGEAEVIVSEADSVKTESLDPSEQDQPDVAAVEVIGEMTDAPETISLIPESDE